MHSVSGRLGDRRHAFGPGPGAVVVSEQLDAVLAPGHEGIGWLAQSG